MNIISLFASFIFAVLFAFFAKQKLKIVTENVFVYFGSIAVAMFLCLMLFSKIEAWWSSTGNFSDMNTIIANMTDDGDILTDTELRYALSRFPAGSLSGWTNDAENHTCSSIAV